MTLYAFKAPILYNEFKQQTRPDASAKVLETGGIFGKGSAFRSSGTGIEPIVQDVSDANTSDCVLSYPTIR